VKISLKKTWVLLAVIVAAGIAFACSQTPTSVPIRTFERAARMDVVCLRVAPGVRPEPLRQEQCSPVPPEVNGGSLENRLFALVTQTGRGEVAVVDLSAGAIVDQSHAVPGLNFLPVGSMPTDIAALPSGKMVFVASAEPNKFAIYGIPGGSILGDQAGKPERVTLASWPVCALPQRPGALAIIPHIAPPTPPTSTVDAGESEAGSEAGAPDAGEVDAGAPDGGPSSPLEGYDLVAVLPGDHSNPASVVTIDPNPFIDGTLRPGELSACPIRSAVKLSGSEVIPPAFVPGVTWEDGIKWVDGGVDLSCALPQKAASCGLPSCQCVNGADAGAGAGDGGVACDPDAGSGPPPAQPLDFGPLDPPQPVAIARDDKTLYVADDELPLVHVIDFSTGVARELPPFVVSSLADPSRPAAIRDVAISPPTRDYKRYLYAVDRKDGAIAVFDVTDPINADRSPMRRPHPELNPFQPADRLVFAAPVVAVAFARHDFPLVRTNNVLLPAAQTGVLCNPNPNATEQDFGTHYRANVADIDVGLGPVRLRGIFAFATLSNGQVVAIDVDDWDAPCRRPKDLDGNQPGVPIGQPAPGPGDKDPYHAPNSAENSTTQEAFFPISAPHRPRSSFLLRNDATTGNHIPFLPSAPSIQSPGAPLPLFGPGSEVTPRLRAPASRPGAVASSQDAIQFSFETPEVHFDQDWVVTYEGPLPGFQDVPGLLTTSGVDEPGKKYQSLELRQTQARFCSKGVEDWDTSRERSAAITSALSSAGRLPPPTEALDRRLVDYVQISDELLAPEDPYWSQADLPGEEACWAPELNNARARYDTCSSVFGTAAQQSPNRDLPILEAYDDHLRLGRFAAVAPSEVREVIYADESNKNLLKLARCCFHNQIHFNVRAAQQWVTVGSVVGFLNHVTRGTTGRCVQSCDQRESLLNARLPSIPFGPGDFAPDRDSPLALRNPAFSFFIQNGQEDGANSIPERDTAYRFQTRGQFLPLAINLAASVVAVNPQSMRFIESLGQLAVVDGASQGLVLIDLAAVSIARQPYF
jgi:hypothetical protein